jgi:hypothetical protein
MPFGRAWFYTHKWLSCPHARTEVIWSVAVLPNHRWWVVRYTRGRRRSRYPLNAGLVGQESRFWRSKGEQDILSLLKIEPRFLCYPTHSFLIILTSVWAYLKTMYLFCGKNAYCVKIRTFRIPLLYHVTVMLCRHLGVLLVFFPATELYSPLPRRPGNRAMPVVNKSSHIVNTTQYVKVKHFGPSMRQCISLVRFQISAGDQIFGDTLCVTLGKCGFRAFK